ncbi:MAG TPA: DUF3426 domain-containing protein [Kiloniellales bacterium]|jgi:predicted Zn finger-like uncharacterized protein
MNLTCPSCTTTFVVEFKQLGPAGRQVRCGSCGHSWYQAAEAEAAAGAAPLAAKPVPAPEAPPARSRRGPRPPPKPEARPGSSARMLGWILFLAVIGGLGAGLYFGREQVVALVPGAANLYQMAGLGPPHPGVALELRDVRTVRRVVDGAQVVVVEGLVANMTDEPQAVPLLRASLTDAKGTELETWTFAASSTTLPASGSTDFETIAKNPPSEGRILIDFVATE